jgi:outer membrane protein assembly factor BamB
MNRRTAALLATVASLIGPVGGVLGQGGSWHQWRGPHRNGRLADGQSLPSAIDGKALRQVWRVELAEGYASPVVADGRVFTVETKDKSVEIVRAFDRARGRQVWEHQWDGAISVPFFARNNGSWVRSTPVYDAENDRLYVGGMREVLVCLAGRTGKPVWRVDFPDQLGSKSPSFGFVCSPLIAGDYIYVQAAGAVCKLNKHTGELVWRSLDDGGGMYGNAFSSPVVARLGGRRQLVVQTRSKLAGLALEDGAVLWAQEIRAFRGMNILTPTIQGNLIFTSAYGGFTHCFEVIDDGGKPAVRERWKLKMQGYMSSPVVIDGNAYLHRRDRKVSCIDLSTGDVTWTSDRRFGEYWSMATDGKRILALDQRGDLILLAADRSRFSLVAQRKVADDAWAHLAVAEGQVFVRSLRALTAYEYSPVTQAPESQSRDAQSAR